MGQAFNCAPTEAVSWKRRFEEIAQLLGARVPRWSVTFSVAYGAGAVLEAFYRLAGSATPPVISRYAAELLGSAVEYDVSKAERLLGWRPRVTFGVGLRDTVAWLQSEGSARSA